MYATQLPCVVYTPETGGQGSNCRLPWKTGLWTKTQTTVTGEDPTCVVPGPE